MDLRITRERDVAVVELPIEELDASNAVEFKFGLAALAAQERRMVCDLSSLRFIDSSGLGALLSGLRKVSEYHGELKLCGLSDAVRDLFALVRMNRVFDIYATRDAAVSAFRAQH